MRASPNEIKIEIDESDHEKLATLHNQIELVFNSFMERGMNDNITQRLILGIFEIWKEQKGKI